MKSWQVITLGIILLSGYAIFAIGGYFVGANVTEQKWEARVAYIAYAEEHICYTRLRFVADAGIIAMTGQLTEETCTGFRKSESSLRTRVATWKSVTPPEEWQGWHADILTATETMYQGYEHLLAACDYHANWDFGNVNMEMTLALGVMQPTIESLKPEHRPWAAANP